MLSLAGHTLSSLSSAFSRVVLSSRRWSVKPTSSPWLESRSCAGSGWNLDGCGGVRLFPRAQTVHMSVVGGGEWWWWWWWWWWLRVELCCDMTDNFPLGNILGLCDKVSEYQVAKHLQGEFLNGPSTQRSLTCQRGLSPPHL